MVRAFSLARLRNDDSDAALRPSMNSRDRCLDLAVVEQGWWTSKSASSQACLPLVVGAGMMSRGLPTRRGLQALALVIATAYATILLYQAIAPRQWVDEMNVAEVNSRSVIVEVPALRKLISEELPMTPPVATATMAPFATNLDDVFISVKTTKHYHHSRLPAIVDTWFQFARNQTWFFTDRDDPYFQNQTNGHMINTKCSSSHNRRALCCKMSVEFDRFLDSGRKKVYNMPRFCGTKTMRRKRRRRKGRRMSCLSSSSSSCREDETDGERLKTKGSGTSWPGDDSISFFSSLPTEAFREGIERTTGDSRRKRKSVSNVTCGPGFLLLFPSLTISVFTENLSPLSF